MKFLHESLCIGLLFLVYAGVGVRAVDGDDDDADDGSLSRVRRGGWNMYRLGRGLQMLRLGKRGAFGGGPSSPLGSGLTPDDLSNWMASNMASHVQATRQLPLPRYGKDADWAEAMLLAEKLAHSGGSLFGGLRPAPRGGRFKRGSGYPPDFAQLLSRAVALPRIGRLIYGEDYDAIMAKVKAASEEKERAVPAPRIGRSV